MQLMGKLTEYKTKIVEVDDYMTNLINDDK